MIDEDIKRIANSLNNLYKTMFALYSPEVNRIIKNKITDKKTIEFCLENLLNAPTDECYDLFLKLCSYYKNIDSKSANEYLEIYKELYFEEEDIFKEPITKKRK